jgi:sugar phosphate permease
MTSGGSDRIEPEQVRRRRVVWGVGVAAYVVTLFERYSLGVASLQARDRFGVGASVLAGFVVLQFLIYAGLQVPVGIVLDRFGPKRLVVIGLVLLAAAQAAFAFAADPAAAVASRVVLGTGDALIFISVIRLVASWFPPQRNPFMVQVTGVVGQLGAVGAATPLLLLLRTLGWRSSFLIASSVAALVALAAQIALRDAPAGADLARPPESTGSVWELLRSAWREPGTRLGLWTHFAAFFPGLTFVVLWGYPFLVQGEGVSPTVAGWLLVALTGAGMVTGPILGRAVAAHPLHRSSMVLAVVAVTAGVWGIVLLWPGGAAPLPLLILLVLMMGSSSPTALIGLDFARTFNPGGRLGTAFGIVNVGGFLATALAVVAIGAALDLATRLHGGGAPLDTYRWAFAAQYPVWLLGLVQVVRHRLALRRALAARRSAASPS